MKTTRVRLKPSSPLFWTLGREVVSVLWEWRPKEGWFSLVNNDGGDLIVIKLDECESATEYGVMTRINHVEDVDLLKLAADEIAGRR